MGKSTRNALTVGYIIALGIYAVAGGILMYTGIAMIVMGSFVGLALVAPGVVILVFGYQKYSQWKKQKATEIPIPDATTVKNEEELLFHWLLPARDWKLFVEGELKQQMKTILPALAVILVLSFIGWFTLSSKFMAVTISIFLIGTLAIAGVAGYLKKKRLFHAKPIVIFKPSGLILDNQVILYRDEIRWPKEVHIRTELKPPVLEIRTEKFRISRYSSGKTEPSIIIRVPIPKDKIEEAEIMKRWIMTKKREV